MSHVTRAFFERVVVLTATDFRDGKGTAVERFGEAANLALGEVVAEPVSRLMELMRQDIK